MLDSLTLTAHSHGGHLVTPIRLSDKDDAFIFSDTAHTHAHALRAESYNYSDRNWQVVLSAAAYCSVSTRN